MKDSATKAKASDHESYGAYTLLSFIVPVIGIILGVVYLAKDKKIDKKFGEHLVAISLLFIIIQGALLGVFWSSLFSTSYVTVPSSQTISTPTTPSRSLFDPSVFYEQIHEGQTKAEVESIVKKKSDDCTTSATPGVGTMELCSYGDVLTDKGILSITYLDGKVYSKTKTSL